MADLRDILSRLRRSYLRHRRLVAAASAAVAVVCVVHIVSPHPPPAVPLVVAAHDLPAGTVLGPSDVHVVGVDPHLVPAGADTSAAAVEGHRLAGPMRAGEPLTDQRLMGRALVLGYPGDVVAAPVRIQDADAVSLLRVGDRVDVYSATGDQSEPARRVVSDAPVVSLPPSDTGDDTHTGALVVLAVTQPEAAMLAQASATTQLSVSLRG
jgi:Flp pilus assembly protein CpaB